MPDYKVQEVLTREELKQFVRFPDELYKDCPQYVPALHNDQEHALTQAAPLKYCTRKMLRFQRVPEHALDLFAGVRIADVESGADKRMHGRGSRGWTRSTVRCTTTPSAGRAC